MPENLVPYDYVIVDCHNLAYRMWWSVHELQTSQGQPTGLEYGFVKGVLALARLWKPAIVVLAWDGFARRCSTIFPKVVDSLTGEETGYKSNRQRHKDKDTEPDWDPRLEQLRNVFLPLIPTLYHPEHEADEEIARFVFAVRNHGKRCLIISRDGDLWQLIDANTQSLDGSAVTDLITAREVEQKWGVPPARLPLRRALEGDSSDRIPGVLRLRKDLIVRLVNQIDQLEPLIELIISGNFVATENQREKLRTNIDLIRRNYQLMNLSPQAGFSPTLLPGTRGDATPALELCRDLEFTVTVSRPEWADLITQTRQLIGPQKDQVIDAQAPVSTS